MVTLTEFWPGGTGTELESNRICAWPSGVVCDPAEPSDVSGIVPVAPLGGLLSLTRSGGGFTHWYGAGGCKPSSTGALGRRPPRNERPPMSRYAVARSSPTTTTTRRRRPGGAVVTPPRRPAGGPWGPWRK